MKQLVGTGVALVTPFNEDFTIDTAALSRIVHYCIDGGVDYLVVLGTTGESVTLNKAEKQLVMQTVVDTNAGRLPLVLGIGGNSTYRVAHEIQAFQSDDFDAILSVSPYYNKPTQEGIYQHFKAIAAVATKPIIMYNVPSRTGSNMLPETVKRLAEDFDNIVGLKEAIGDMNQINQLLKICPKDFHIISGDDITAMETTLAGGSGVISVLGQGLPEQFSKMIRLALDKKSDEARLLHKQMEVGMDMIFEEGNPAGIKSIFETMSISRAAVRLPLVEATEGLKEKLSIFMKPFQKVSV